MVTDDIVTRLRAFDSQTGVFSIDMKTFGKAADEIERLRNALTNLGEYVSELETERNELQELVRRNAHP